MLDLTSFIAEKEGNPEAIRESQKKRGSPPEAVDEIIALYAAWTKRPLLCPALPLDNDS